MRQPAGNDSEHRLTEKERAGHAALTDDLAAALDVETGLRDLHRRAGLPS